MADPLSGIDPQLAATIQSLMGGGQLSEEDKKYARQQGLLSAAAGLLTNMYKPTGIGLGQGLGAGLLGYNEAQQTVRRNKLVDAENMQKAIQTAGGLQALKMQTQRQGQISAFLNQLTGGQSGAAPQQAPAPGMPQIQPGALPGVSAPQSVPQSSPQQVPQQLSLKQKLLNMGIPEISINAAAMSADPIAEVEKLVTEYNKPVFGMGKIPYMRTATGFRAAPVEGANDVLSSQTYAEQSATERAKAENDLVKIPVGNREVMVPRSLAVQMLGGGQQPSGRVSFNFAPGTGPSASQMAEIQKDIQGQPSAFSPAPQQGGQFGMTADPIEQARLKGAVDAQTAQNTDISKGYAQDYLTAVKGEQQAPINIAKYNLLKSYMTNVSSGKAAPTVQSLKQYAAYFAPDLAKSWTADVPFAQAAGALANEMALQLRNPASGGGMPGNLSNQDRDFLVSMIASVSNDPRAIPMILDARIALEKRNQEIGKLARDYRKQHGQIDEGFNQVVQDFANTHPIFPQNAQAPQTSGGNSGDGWSAKRVN